MNGTDIFIYSYLTVLLIASLIYGIIVVVKGGIDQSSIRINVVLPPNIIQNTTAQAELASQLFHLSNITDGVTIPVWWGLVETSPKYYNWSAYSTLFDIVRANLTNATIKVSLNFHSCNNSFTNEQFCEAVVPLPEWVTAVRANYSIFYADVNQYSAQEYLTCGVDHVGLFLPSNRTAVQMYIDFVQAFSETFQNDFDSLIYEVEIGLGPAGQLRYPAFPSQWWKSPGIGQFQCYDSFLAAEYLNYAMKLNPQYAFLPLPGAVEYNYIPSESPFFNSKSNINGSTSDYGQFFLTWYSQRLIQHGAVILGQAVSVLRTYSPNVTVSGGVGCIYWQSKDSSHAAEFTAGYMNYTTIANMFSLYQANINYPCFDLNADVNKYLNKSDAAPQQLLSNMLDTASAAGIQVEGTNSKLDYSEQNIDLILSNLKHNYNSLASFDFRYVSDDLMENLENFKKLADTLHSPSHK